jgi:ABC-type lipoprotein release transport system permease subunit
MGSYLQQYGVEETRRNRTVKVILISAVTIIVLALVAYLILHNYFEKRVAKQFLSEVNAGQYQKAYETWGCTAQHPCPNYDYQRFLEDWGPAKKKTGSWEIAETDSCRSFLTVNVQAPGTELQSLAVQRSDKSLGFAPAPECQERQWRWKAFFHRIFGGGAEPPK